MIDFTILYLLLGGKLSRGLNDLRMIIRLNSGKCFVSCLNFSLSVTKLNFLSVHSIDIFSHVMIHYANMIHVVTQRCINDINFFSKFWFAIFKNDKFRCLLCCDPARIIPAIVCKEFACLNLFCISCHFENLAISIDDSCAFMCSIHTEIEFGKFDICCMNF